jgi:hypothetical protein
LPCLPTLTLLFFCPAPLCSIFFLVAKLRAVFYAPPHTSLFIAAFCLVSASSPFSCSSLPQFAIRLRPSPPSHKIRGSSLNTSNYVPTAVCVMIALINYLMSPHSDVRPFDPFGAGADGSTYAV